MKRIAIVDDDHAAREALQFLLNVLGWRPESFASAVAFLETEADDYACIILDQHMPVMTGLELARGLRSRGSPVPILLISGNLTADVVDKARQVGIDLVSDKPPDLKLLFEFIDGALGAR